MHAHVRMAWSTGLSNVAAELESDRSACVKACRGRAEGTRGSCKSESRAIPRCGHAALSGALAQLALDSAATPSRASLPVRGSSSPQGTVAFDMFEEEVSMFGGGEEELRSGKRPREG